MLLWLFPTGEMSRKAPSCLLSCCQHTSMLWLVVLYKQKSPLGVEVCFGGDIQELQKTKSKQASLDEGIRRGKINLYRNS